MEKEAKTNDTTALVVQTDQPLAIAPANDAGVFMQMMQKVINDGNLTAEKAEVMKTIAGLYEHMQDRDAKQAYNIAFNKMMKEMKPIQATKEVPNDDKSVRYTYAPFEEIDEQLRPVALRFGFTYCFKEGESTKPDRITKICIVRHEQGHEVLHPYTVRIGAGPPKTSDSQKDGSAHTYAKRGALCDAFNIVVKGQDNDAQLDGAPITPAQAANLRKRVKDTGSDEPRFLKYAGADKYEEIASTMFDTLDQLLKKRESTK
jgi:hypothetical protein